MKNSIRLIPVILAMLLLIPFLPLEAIKGGWVISAEEVSPEEADENLDSFVEPEYHSAFIFPEELRGVFLTPGVDFGTEEITAEAVNAELDKIMEDIASKGLNGIILNTDDGEKPYYSLDVNRTVDVSLIELAIEAAQNHGMYVYLTFDINLVMNYFYSKSLQERIDNLALQAHVFTAKYGVDGIILKGYYSSKNEYHLDDYLNNGSGIGFENWLLDKGAYVFSLVSDAVRKTDNTVPVGMFLKDVWANYTTKEGGSVTADAFQALTDGYADTLGYLQNGYADFIMLEAEGSLTDTALPFEEIVGWWGRHAFKAEIPMYVLHDNEKICTDAPGWAYSDQLARQLIAARAIAGYKGSAFNSYSSLRKNLKESTDAVVKYYGDTLNLETIDNELNIISPTRTTFTTEDPTVAFMGSFDPNFKVYFNGQIIKLNEAGNFYYEEELDEGLNIFTIENKGKTITYRITRKVEVLKSISPSIGEMTVEERTNIVVSAVAYRGSSVSASLNGKNIPMEASDVTPEGYENTNYVLYTGSYVAPKGIINKAQNLGTLSVYGRFKGKNGVVFEKSLQGATVIVNALPEIPNNADGNLMRLKYDNTKVFSAKSTSSDPAPDQARLPAGTMDYIVKQVKYDGVNYYTTNTGKRIQCSEVQVLENAPLGINKLQAAGVEMSGLDTVVKIRQNVKSPFSFDFNGITYVKSGTGDYAVSSFNANSLTITFDYSNGAAGEFQFPGNAMFSSAYWGTSGEKTTLTLNFARTGCYNGVNAYYEGDTLMFKFNGYPRSLQGAVIVIDPGHGKTASGGLDPGGVGHVTDQAVGLAVAKQLEQKLRAAGATVYRLPTESQFIDTISRADYARRYNPDIYISLHGNKAPGSPSANGVEAFYFNPYAQPLAKFVSASIANYYSNTAYGDGKSHNRGDKFNTFWVTLDQSYASILVELGFVSNYNEAMMMNKPENQAGIADAIMKGIAQYLAR